MALNSAPSNDVSSVNTTGQTPEADNDEVQDTPVEGAAQEASPVEETPAPAEEEQVEPVAEGESASDDTESLAEASPEAEPEPVAEAEEETADGGESEAEAAETPAVAEPPAVAEVVGEAEAPVEEAPPAATESVAAAAEAPAEAAVPEDAAVAEPPSRLKRGEIVEGTVVQTSPTEVLIRLDDDLFGIISGRELARMDRTAFEELQVDNNVLVYVLNPSNRNGQAILSLTRALEERDWRQAQEYAESQELYTGKVSGYNKGGLIVRFGRVRGFIPASQVSEERRQSAVGDSPMERWGSMIGEDVIVKVVEVDRHRNRLILSERSAVKEYRDQRKAELLEKLKVGDVRKGKVVSLTDFGAFVDLGGADGLIHLTELSWKHVTRPEEVVSVGDEVQVEIISLDRERRRIGLSLKSQEKDPWQVVADKFQVGQLVKGTITKLTKFGAFACLEDAPEIEGLIHISELSDHRVGHPREVVNEGEELTLRIVKIDRAQRRMGLSLKQVDAVDYLEIDLATYGNDAQPPLVDGIETVTKEDDETEK